MVLYNHNKEQPQQPVNRTPLLGLEIAQVLLVTINLKHSIERGNVHKKIRTN